MPAVRKKCPHNREKHLCRECGGASICEHDRRRSTCKSCGGSAICEHSRVRSSCKVCGGSSILARSAAAPLSASTVTYEADAPSAAAAPSARGQSPKALLQDLRRLGRLPSHAPQVQLQGLCCSGRKRSLMSRGEAKTAACRQGFAAKHAVGGGDADRCWRLACGRRNVRAQRGQGGDGRGLGLQREGCNGGRGDGRQT